MPRINTPGIAAELVLCLSLCEVQPCKRGFDMQTWKGEPLVTRLLLSSHLRPSAT